MARHRTIDALLWKHKAFLREPWHCRDVFLYLLLLGADDDGRFYWDEISLLDLAFQRAYPVTEEDVASDLETLKEEKLIARDGPLHGRLLPPWDKCCKRPMTHKWFSDTVKARDRRCLVCGCETNLRAHHIVPKSLNPKLKDKPSNGITLCDRCHKGIRGRELAVAEDLRALLAPREGS